MAELGDKLHDGTRSENATMQFEFQNPTRLIFGAGTLSRLGGVAGEYGNRALLVTEGGSVKRNGTFDRAVASLKNAGVSVVECSGVEPNPRVMHLRQSRRPDNVDRSKRL
jgi:alcohol dehydrogenase YqhD (iron-dependent ADH family)